MDKIIGAGNRTSVNGVARDGAGNVSAGERARSFRCGSPS